MSSPTTFPKIPNRQLKSFKHNELFNTKAVKVKVVKIENHLKAFIIATGPQLIDYILSLSPTLFIFYDIVMHWLKYH